MTDESPREIDWPTRSRAFWGVLGLVAVLVVAVSIVWFGNKTDEPEPDLGDQFEWSIDLVDQTGDTISLKADEPSGFPTETWRNDFRVARSADGTFEWDTDAGLPGPVVEIDLTEGCEALNVELAKWVAEMGAGEGDPLHWQARAFAQYALNTMRADGCPLNDTALDDL